MPAEFGFSKAHLREAADQCAQGDLALEASKDGAQTEVRALAERQVAVVTAAQVQHIGLNELGRVTVGCAEHQQHMIASMQLLTA